MQNGEYRFWDMCFVVGRGVSEGEGGKSRLSGLFRKMFGGVWQNDLGHLLSDKTQNSVRRVKGKSGWVVCSATGVYPFPLPMQSWGLGLLRVDLAWDSLWHCALATPVRLPAAGGCTLPEPPAAHSTDSAPKA